MLDCSLASLKQNFSPLGYNSAPKQLLIMDHYAYNLVYGDDNGLNPEDFLPTISPDQAPERLLFPSHRPLPKKEERPAQSMELALYKPEEQVQILKEPKVDLLKYRNPHLLEPSTFNIRHKDYYLSTKNGQVVRPHAFADI